MNSNALVMRAPSTSARHCMLYRSTEEEEEEEEVKEDRSTEEEGALAAAAGVQGVGTSDTR